MGGSQGKSIKKTLKEIPDVNPFNPLNNIDVNFEKMNEIVDSNLEKEKKIYEENRKRLGDKIFEIDSSITRNDENSNSKKSYITFDYFERSFSNAEKEYLKNAFLTYSSDEIMSNRQFWSFLNLEFIYTTTFGKTFYQTICEFNEPTKLEFMKFMDLKKFMQFVCIFTKKPREDEALFSDLRKKFVFRLFDIDISEEIDKLEFRNFLTAFLEMILTCNFENEIIQNKIKHLRSEATNVQLIEKALDQYVEEVYNNTYDGYVMTYEEWEKWISSIDGIDEIDNFVGSLPGLAGNIG